MNNGKKFFIINLCVGIFTYFMIISLQLVNQLDGIWNSEFDYAGNWERGIGRWIWPYYDKLRFGVQTDPMCSVAALCIFILGNMVVINTVGISFDDIKAYIIGLLLIVNTSVDIWMSFRYMSVTFAMAYLFAVLAVKICKMGGGTTMQMSWEV